jgi:hypothetical protein
MAGTISRLLKDTYTKARDKLSDRLAGWAVAALVALLALSRPVWQRLGSWFLGIDPEVARQAVFLLSAALFLLVYAAPRRRIPIDVSPVGEPGREALLSVRNKGEGAAFYTGMEVLAGVTEGGSGLNLRRVTLRPSWWPETAGADYINRDEVKTLCIALESEIEHFDLMSGHGFAAELADAHGRGERVSWGEEDGVRIRVRVTIGRYEKRKARWQLRYPRAYTVDFCILGHASGGLSVEFAPSRRRS